MPITFFQPTRPGQVTGSPQIIPMSTTNTSTEVTTAGYLDSYVQSSGFVVYEGDFVFVKASDESLVATVSISAGSITLTDILD